MTWIAFSSVGFQASADEPTEDAAEVVHGADTASTGPQPNVDDTDADRVRPAHLIDVPPGVILEPRDENGRRVTFRPDQEYKCFPVDQWAQMGDLITDYRWLWYYAIRMETKLQLFEQQIGNLQLQIKVWEDTHAATRNGLVSITNLLDKEHDARLNVAARADLELWGWRIATVVALVATGAFGAAWGVERSR